MSQESTDINLVAQQSYVMNFRSPRLHLEKVAILDFQLVRRLAVRTIDAEIA